MKPFLLVLSSPSGGGKTTIARSLLDGRDDLGYSISATTRAMRPGEVDARDYHFLTRDEFQRRVAAGSEVEALFGRGKIAVLDIDVQGAEQIRAAMPDAVLVFVLPPSAEVLVQRLRARNTEPAERIRQRLNVAALEVVAAPSYDYVVENDNLVTAVSVVASIIEAELHRATRHDELPRRVEQFRENVLDEARRIS